MIKSDEYNDYRQSARPLGSRTWVMTKRKMEARGTLGCTAGGPLPLHKSQPLTKASEKRNLQLGSGPTGHDRGMSGPLDREHVPYPSDHAVRHGTRGIGQSSMVNTLGFPESKQIVSAKNPLSYCFREDMTYWQDSGCHCENTGTTPSFLYSSSRSFPFWIAWTNSGNGWTFVRS